jgi:pyruvate formate lyase activating enzyme
LEVDAVLKEIARDTIFYDQSGGGVTFSGGEPLDQSQFLGTLLEGCKALDIHTAVDTSCFAPRAVLAELAPLIDLFLCDIKHMDPILHLETTGVPNELILENIRWLAENDHALVIRYPLIPDCNDGTDNIRAMGEFIAGLPGEQKVDILPYHPGNQSKGERLSHKQSIFMAKAPIESQISMVQSILGEFGLETKVGG